MMLVYDSQGYDGNGIDCLEVEANCAQEDICDVHADCVYNGTLRKSSCICQVNLIEISFFKLVKTFTFLSRKGMKETEEHVIWQLNAEHQQNVLIKIHSVIKACANALLDMKEIIPICKIF